MPKSRLLLTLALFLPLLLLAPGNAWAVLGTDDGPAGTAQSGDPTGGLGDVSTWLPEGYFQGPSPGRQRFLQGRQSEVRVALPEDRMPWSFDTFNGKHNLLAFRKVKGGTDFGQSPLEKYDTLLAYHQNKDGSGSRIEDRAALAALRDKGAALWEADPANQHNRAEVTCRSSGGGSEPAKVRRQVEEYIGDIHQVEVGGGEGAGDVVVYRGRSFPVTRTQRGSHRGVTYVYYFYDQDVSYFLDSGASALPSKALSPNQRPGSQGTLADGVFTEIVESRDPSQVGTWGHGAWQFDGIQWARKYNPEISARLEKAATGDRVTLRWGRDLEHKVDNAVHAVEPFLREESEHHPGRLPAPEDEWVMERRYEVDVYHYESGVLLPGTRPGETPRYARCKLVLFPGRDMRRKLRSWGRDLPEGSGWTHHYWIEEDSSQGVSWSGHCAGFSAASVLFREPPARKTIRLGKSLRKVRLDAAYASEACASKLYYESFGDPVQSIVFDNRDLKGLAIELGQSVEVGFEHPVRDSGDREMPGVKVDYPAGAAGRWTSYGSAQESWDDILPHNLHIILLDLLKQRKQSLVMDRHPCDPVWNSPVFGYDFQVTGNAEGRRYEVVAQVHYAGYGRSYGNGVKDPNTRGTQHKVYPRDGVAPYAGDHLGQLIKGEALRFYLHVDENNRVERSEWRGKTISCTDYKRDSSGKVISREKVKREVAIHPDAIWVPTRLAASRRSRRGRVNRNPNLDIKLITEDYPVLTDMDNGEPYLHPWAR